MNVLLVSQCSKRALVKTRRILDQFAERRGDRTWQTAITMQGLQTLHKMLRSTARKNTAVACHWIRGRDHSELMWVVGDASRFNAQGATPTNTTQRDVLRGRDENDWHTAEDIRLLATIGALLHDLGKANDAFQKKLSPKNKKPISDAYRHEWVSLRLFAAFVGDDSDVEWLHRLAELKPEKSPKWLAKLVKDGLDHPVKNPFKLFSAKAPLARLFAWLIVSHHRMPTPGQDDALWPEDMAALPKPIASGWCGSKAEADEKEKIACWTFSKGLPFASKHWCEHIAKASQQVLRRPQLLNTTWLDDPYVLHMARLGLMLADHHYSAQDSKPRYGDAKFPLIANTKREEGNAPNQRLDEHLIGVGVNASRIIQTLPRMATQLARIARHKGFRQRSKVSRFRWQDRAYDLAVSLQTRSERQGFFGVNMASTGCGKTLANGRIMYGLANPKLGARFNIALGLRTLTLQTGEAYRSRLGLGDEDLAVLVGGGAVRELFESQKRDSINARSGSESLEDMLPDNHHVHFEGSLEDGPLNRWLGENRDAKKLLNAPILTCTIDHLMPATEGTRGGRQIAPMLRLMSSDLVLDEPDDFSLDDLPALARLVNWAGMLGSRVLLSSATLPPAMIEGLFQAYLSGREIYQRNRGVPGSVLNVCCAWFDEFSTQSSEQSTATGFMGDHSQFVQKRLAQLHKSSTKEQRRKAAIKPLAITPRQPRETICSELAAELHRQLHELHHAHHETDPRSGKRVSFGLIRMANINPMVEVARALSRIDADEDSHIHLCVYHSQHPLLVRSAIENKLDRLLNRNEGRQPFNDEEVQRLLKASPSQNHIFVILATPVAEVGRDHDYDWAIVEPSSMRSIIQLAGRVRRHRAGSTEPPNIYLMETNVRHLEQGGSRPAYTRPGFEGGHFKLQSHHLNELLTEEQLRVIDASTRIQERASLQPQGNLVDLEHAAMRALMTGTEQPERSVTLWWQTRAHLSGYLQQIQRFRNDPVPRQRCALLLDEDEIPRLHYREVDGTYTRQDSRLHRVTVECAPHINFWGAPDYLETLFELADMLGMEPDACARRFGYLDLPEDTNGKGWYYHPALGFWR